MIPMEISRHLRVGRSSKYAGLTPGSICAMIFHSLVVDGRLLAGGREDELTA